MTLPPKNAVFRISRREMTFFALRRRILFQNPRAGHDPPLQVCFDMLKAPQPVVGVLQCVKKLLRHSEPVRTLAWEYRK